MTAVRWGRVLLVSATYLFLCALGGAILAWLLAPWVEIPFMKLLTRSVLLFAALGLVPLWRLGGLTVTETGLRPDNRRAFWRACRVGFLAGIAVILPIAVFFYVVGFRHPDPAVQVLSWSFAGLLAWLLVSAWLVAVFEEVLFRGVLYTWLRRYTPFLAAAGVSSALYASFHFLDPAEIEVAPAAWYTGLAHIADAFGGLAQLATQWDAWFALFLLGGLLCWVRQELGLWWAIALHASWVFVIRTYKELTVRDIFNRFQPWSGDFDNFTGGLVAGWLLFLFVVVALYRRWAATRVVPGVSTETLPPR